jgi:hypothetical protein
MTARALIIGFLGAFFIAGFTYFNNFVLRQTPLFGHFLPPTVFGILLLLILLNPLLRYLGRDKTFQPREFVLVLAMCLVAGGIGGYNTAGYLGQLIMLPHLYEKTQTGWEESGLIDRLPDHMLADPGLDEQALTTYVSGMGRPDQTLSLLDIPWEAWLPALSFWVPLILLMWVAMLGLAMVVHPQWARNEHLPYPLVTIFQAFLPRDDGQSSSIFKSRGFWVCGGFVFLIYYNNFLASHFPNMVQVPLEVDLSRFIWEAPPEFYDNLLRRGLEGTIIFSVIAVAYVIPRATSFSLGIAPFLFGIAVVTLRARGITLETGRVYSGESFWKFGTFLGLTCAILYTGRHYYLGVLCQALRLPGRKKLFSQGEVTATSLLGMRLFLFCLAGFNVLLLISGIDLLPALTFTLFLVIIYLVLGRVIAETGMMYFNVAVGPALLLIGFYGMDAITPLAFLTLALVSKAFFNDAKENLMPFVINSFKFLDDAKIPLRKASLALGSVMTFGLVIALATALYFAYDGGTINMHDRSLTTPQNVGNSAVRHLQFLQSQDGVEDARRINSLQRLFSIEVFSKQSACFLVGLLLVLATAAARLRFTWWPLHPIMFVVAASWGTAVIAASFLFGLFIKTVVLKFGGQKAFVAGRPLIFGLLAGEIMAIMLINLSNYVIFLVTGNPPQEYDAIPF